MNDAYNSEKLLIIGLNNDDQFAFKQLYERYAPRLQAFSFKLKLDKEAASEIVQETFIRVWLNRHVIDSNANFAAYLFAIARNLMYDAFRKAAHASKYATLLAQELRLNSAQDNIPHTELAALIHSAMAELPEKCRQVFKMSRLDGFSNNEIATTLNISKSTVENQLNKALKLIRKYLENSGYALINLYFILFF